MAATFGRACALPGARWLCRATRFLDEALVRAPLLERLAGNFELLTRRSG